MMISNQCSSWLAWRSADGLRYSDTDTKWEECNPWVRIVVLRILSESNDYGTLAYSSQPTQTSWNYKEQPAGPGLLCVVTSLLRGQAVLAGETPLTSHCRPSYVFSRRGGNMFNISDSDTQEIYKKSTYSQYQLYVIRKGTLQFYILYLEYFFLIAE